MKRFVDLRMWLAGVCVVAMSGAAVQRAEAAPVFGQTFRLPQPDGTQIEVRIWGDEFYGITETLDGYAVVRDPDTLSFCYARLSKDGNDLISTGVSVGQPAPADPSITPHLRISSKAAQAKARTARLKWEEEGRTLAKHGAVRAGPTTGVVQGLCLIVDFWDDRGMIPPYTVSAYCNEEGFTGYGDNGSVHDYYYDVSDGQLMYWNYVPAAYYRAAQFKPYYTDPNVQYGVRARELITEALTYLDNNGFDFSPFDADGDGYIDALNCFYAGASWNNWAEGLWPHSGYMTFCADGVCTYRYQISDMGAYPAALYLFTFCHENGHMLMGWPDLYDYDYDSNGVGEFCLMGYGTIDTNPCKPCAYLRHVAGWSSTTVLTLPQMGLSVPSDSNTFYKYDHPTNLNEYYIIENRQQTGRDAELPDAGLAIWHVDTEGNNSNQQMTPESHYLVTLVQADGLWDLEYNVNYGDATDLWAAPSYTQCMPGTSPNTNWWSGLASNLFVTNISASGPTMTFDFNAPDCNNNGLPDFVDIANGTSQDCNYNGVPDECDIDGGTSHDWDANGRPDECDFDCNQNGSPDVCDLPDGCEVGDCYLSPFCGTSLDSPPNGIPDECQPENNDCNQNAVPDEDDIMMGFSLDCQPDGVPDECQLEDDDCNFNAIPDECDVPPICWGPVCSQDCQPNCIPDECELANNDCNANNIPDDCDIASGFSQDCSADGIPDECQPDTDGDGLIDPCDPCPNRWTGDVSGNGSVGWEDVGPFVSVLLDPGVGQPDDLCAADVDQSGSADGRDIQPFVSLLIGT
jgi:M6 family metalloprotease-like protein